MLVRLSKRYWLILQTRHCDRNDIANIIATRKKKKNHFAQRLNSRTDTARQKEYLPDVHDIAESTVKSSSTMEKKVQ